MNQRLFQVFTRPPEKREERERERETTGEAVQVGQRETLFNPPQPSTAETHWQHRAANQTVNQPRRRMTKKAEAET